MIFASLYAAITTNTCAGDTSFIGALSAHERRFAQHDPHRIEEIDGEAQGAGGGGCGVAQAEHAPQLKIDERNRNDLPGMIDVLDGESQACRQSAQAVL